jgi:hypothetical protein
MDQFGWQQTLVIFAVTMLAVLPLSLGAGDADGASQPARGHGAPQSLRQALGEAFAHRSYVLLVLGFFTCGFQLAFITVHLPAYLDRSRSLRARSAAGRWRRSVFSTSSVR